LPPFVFIALKLLSILNVAPELVSAMNTAADKRASRSRSSKVEIESLIAWAESAIKAGQEIPEGLISLLENVQEYKDALLSNNKRRSAVLLRRLRLSMGILPKSERNRQSGDLHGNKNVDGCNRLRPKTKAERLMAEIARLKHLEEWHKDHCKKNRTKKRKLQKMLNDGRFNIEDLGDDEELSPEEVAENAKEQAEHHARASSGGGAAPEFNQPHQDIVGGGIAVVETDFESVEVQYDPDPDEVLVQTFADPKRRVRYDLEIVLTRVEIEVEKKVFERDGDRKVVSGSTHRIGPEKMKVTWNFLAQIAVQCSHVFIPFNRLAKVLSTEEKVFSASEIYRYFHYVARRCLPVYNFLGSSIADSSHFQGDDTKTKNLEVIGALAANLDPRDLPWSTYATKKLATETIDKEIKNGKTLDELPLALLTSKEWGFAGNKAGKNEPIVQFVTSLILGRIDSKDPLSSVAFFRSHFGHFGLILDEILGHRLPKNKQITIISDLSNQNLVRNNKVLERFSLSYAGCLSHARRPFAQFQDEDPLFCGPIINLFTLIFIHEKVLDLYGRNAENILAVRKHDVLPYLEEMKWYAEILKKKWPTSHPLGKGADYFLNHFEKLTRSINDPMIPLTNNLSESLLRPEKQIQAGSMFRNTIEGRIALDINRTIGQTVLLTGHKPLDYFNWLLPHSPEEIAVNPEKFSPHAFALLPPEKKARIPRNTIKGQVRDLVTELIDLNPELDE